MKTALACLLLCSACSSKDDAPKPTPGSAIAASATTQAAPKLDLTKPCLPAALADANVALVRADGARATVCYGNGDDSPGSSTQCLVVDETGAVLEAAPWAAVAAARDTPRLEDGDVRYTDGELTYCSASAPVQCATMELDLGSLPDNARVTGATNLDRTQSFLFVPRPRDGWRGLFIDLRTEKQVGDIELGSLDKGVFATPFHDARWVGNRILVGEFGDPDDPKDKAPHRTYLVASSGEHVALGADPVVVDTELVIAVRGKSLRFIDVEKVAEVATLTAPGKDSAPVGGVRIARFSDHLVVAHARPAGVMFVERDGREKSRVALPLCK